MRRTKPRRLCEVMVVDRQRDHVIVHGSVAKRLRRASRETYCFVIGSARFRKTSSVEGIVYSPRMKGASRSKGKALSPEERRKAIIKAYRKA